MSSEMTKKDVFFFEQQKIKSQACGSLIVGGSFLATIMMTWFSFYLEKGSPGPPFESVVSAVFILIFGLVLVWGGLFTLIKIWGIIDQKVGDTQSLPARYVRWLSGRKKV